MQAVWFRNAKTKEDKEKVKQDIALAYNAFKHLTNLLNSKKKKYPSDYNEANWAYHQADVNGYNRAIEEILTLITPEGV